MKLSYRNIFLSLIICALFYLVHHKFLGASLFDIEKDTKANADTILSTIAAIGGVIIAMYYAGILSLGTSVYTKLPKDAKELLANEPIGSVFINFLAFLTFVSVVLLSLRFLGYSENILAIQTVLLLSGVAIFSVTKLGARLFYLIDPTELSQTSLRILDDLFQVSAVGKFQWNNPNFQRRNKNQTKTALRTVQLLCNYAKSEGHLSSESYLQLCQQKLSTLFRYQNKKREIPGFSSWYESKFKHKPWYHQSEMSLEASDLIGYIQPEQIRDKLWIESELTDGVSDCFEVNFRAKKYDIADECIRYASWLLRRVAKNGEIEFALELHDKIDSSFIRMVEAIEVLPTDRSSQLKVFNICDSIGAMKSIIILGFLEYVEELNELNIKQVVEKIDWMNPKTLYSQSIPYQIHDRLLFICEKIKFENEIEGSKITPDWYILNLIVQELAFGLNDKLETLFKSALKKNLPYDYPTILKNTLPNRKPLIAINCFYLDRKIEHVRKLKVVLEKSEDIWSNFFEKCKLEQAAWPVINWPAKWEQISKVELQYSEDTARLGGLYGFAREEDIPDFSGKFLHRTGNSIIEHLVCDNPVFSENLYKFYFINSLSMFGELRKGDSSDPKWLIENRMQIAVAPIIDLLDVSGYVFLISEYSGITVMADFVKKTWNEYLSKEDKKNRLELLAAITSIPENSFMTIPYRSILRNKWFQIIRDYLLTKVPTNHRSHPRRGGFGYDDNFEVEHKSPLVRAFLRRQNMTLGFEGEKIFIDRYLLTHNESKDLNFSRDQGDVNRHIEEEENERTEE